MGESVMLRKRRQPAPFFRVAGAPFNPGTGERAPIGREAQRGTTLALFQVIGDPPHAAADADTHDNYVVCRGYEADHDPHFRYLHDPYTKEDTTPIHVAKPYSVRGTKPYKLGQVIVAARILHRLGYNPGKAKVTTGQPADLDEEVELLLDDDEKSIAWMDVATPVPVAGGYFYTAGPANVAADSQIQVLISSWTNLHGTPAGCEAINGPTFWGVKLNVSGVWEFACRVDLTKVVGSPGDQMSVGTRLNSTGLLIGGSAPLVLQNSGPDTVSFTGQATVIAGQVLNFITGPMSLQVWGVFASVKLLR